MFGPGLGAGTATPAQGHVDDITAAVLAPNDDDARAPFDIPVSLRLAVLVGGATAVAACFVTRVAPLPLAVASASPRCRLPRRRGPPTPSS